MRRASLILLAATALGLSLLISMSAHAIRPFNGINVHIPNVLEKQDGSAPDLGKVERARVHSAIQAVADAWNSGNLDPVLLPGFHNRQRLLDTMDQTVPKDARLIILSVGDISTLSQHTKAADEDKGQRLAIRTVSAIVNSQIEFDDPVTGHQRLQGRYEWILQFRDSLPER